MKNPFTDEDAARDQIQVEVSNNKKPGKRGGKSRKGRKQQIVQAVHEAPQQISQQVRQCVFARDGHVCVYCGEPATTINHVIPLYRGGTSHPDNLSAACCSCNDLKRSCNQRGGGKFWIRL